MTFLVRQCQRHINTFLFKFISNDNISQLLTENSEIEIKRTEAPRAHLGSLRRTCHLARRRRSRCQLHGSITAIDQPDRTAGSSALCSHMLAHGQGAPSSWLYAECKL